jgi:hypothetical protein
MCARYEGSPSLDSPLNPAAKVNRQVRKIAIAALAVPALGVASVVFGLALAAKGLTSTTLPPPPSTVSGKSTGSKVSGTEHVSGVVTGGKALAHIIVFHLTWAGPVNTAGNWAEPNGPTREGQLETFTTAAGKLTFEITSPPDVNAGIVNQAACEVEESISVHYAVYGAQSTGKWAGAAGSGKVTIVNRGDLPKLSGGQCASPSNANPIAASASDTFSADGPLTVVKS